MGGAEETRDPGEVKVENAVRQDGDSNPATQDAILAPNPQGYRCHECQLRMLAESAFAQIQLFVHQWKLTAK